MKLLPIAIAAVIALECFGLGVLIGRRVERNKCVRVDHQEVVSLEMENAALRAANDYLRHIQNR